MRQPSHLARRRVHAAVVGLLVVSGLGFLAGPAPAADDARSPRTTLDPLAEVWQVAETASPENPSNPLAGRRWGVYQGPQDPVSRPYVAATGARKMLLAKIAERPRTKWYGAWVGDSAIRE